MHELLVSWANASGMNLWIYTILVFFICLFGLLSLRRLMWARIRQWTNGTTASWDNLIVDTLSTPVTVLAVIASFGIAGQTAPPEIRTHPILHFGVKITLIAVAVWVVERLMALFFRSSALPDSFSSTTRVLLINVLRVIILALGILIILDTVGISITPILASLGVGSVAVALALQDTLSNFFGGLYILVDKPIRIGDFVKVENIEGTVQQIGWRSTRIRQLSNNTVIVPNSRVSSSLLMNYDLPASDSALVFELGVAYESDLEQVEQVTIEVAQEVQRRVPGAVAEHIPVVRFHTFADSSVNFSVVLRVKTFVDSSLVKHEFAKAIHVRYAAEGISIPYPQRTLRLLSDVQLPETKLTDIKPAL